MTSTTTPAAPPTGTHTPGGTLIALPPTGGVAGAGGSGGTAATGTTSALRIANTNLGAFNIPSGIHFGIFDGNNWAHWSRTMEAILVMYEADDVIRHQTCPSGTDIDEWAAVHQRAKAYLRLYIRPDIYSHIASETDLPTFKEKWDVLNLMYGGAIGSTTIFNLWVSLIQTTFDDTTPMAAQLSKANELRLTLYNASMGVSDVQYSLILLKALPPSYEVLVSTILAAGTSTSLDHCEVTARILNDTAGIV